MIHIAVIEDLRDVAEIFCEQLNHEMDFECRHVYFNAEDAMHFLPNATEVNIAIVDIGLPRASGIDAIRYLAENCPQMQFCMFTVYEDDDKIFESLRAGANGYILKGRPIDQVISGIRELHAGGAPMSPSIARRLVHLVQKSQPQNTPAVGMLNLSKREIQILELLQLGLLYKEIASELQITTGTVKQHIHKIYQKLHVSNRTEAINKFQNRF